MKISVKYSLLMASIAALLLVGLIVVFETELLPTQIDTLLDNSRSLAKTIQKAAPSMNKVELQTLMQELIKEQGNLSYILVMDTNCIAIAHSDASRVGMTFNDTGTIKTAKRGEYVEQVYLRDKDNPNSIFHNEEVEDIVVPYYDSTGKHSGAINVGVSLNKLSKLKTEYNLYLIALCGLIVIIFILLTKRILSGIVKPLKILSDSANKITRGEYDVSILMKSDDEIGALTQNFDAMARNIKELVSDLKGKEDELLKYINSLITFTAKLNPDGRILILSSSITAFVNKKPEELIGQYFYNLDIWDASEYALKLIKEKIKMAASGATVNCLTETKDKDLNKVTLECWINPIFNSEGKIQYLIFEGRDITQRVLASERVEAWAKRYELTIALSGQVVYQFDYSDKRISWGGSIQGMLGYTIEEIDDTEQFWDNNIIGIDASRTADSRIKALKTNRNYEIEYRIKKKSGELIWVLDRGFYIKNNLGAPIRLLGMLSDITKRKKDEEVQKALLLISQSASASSTLDELCESIHRIVGQLMPANNFYIALYNPINDSISFPYFIDEEDEYPAGEVELKRSLTAYVIRTGQKLLASPEIFYDLASKGEVDQVGAPSIDWMGAPLKIEGRVIGVIVLQSYKDGVRFSDNDLDILDFVSNQIAMSIERKRAEEALKNAYNKLEEKVQERTAQWQQANEELQALLDERVQIENEIRESEARFRSLADSAPAMIWMCDEDGVFDYFNQVWLEFTGNSFEDELGNRWMKSVHGADIEELKAELDLAIEKQAEFSCEYRFLRFDGEFRWVVNNGAPRLMDDGTFLGLVGSCFDITERKNTEAKIRDSLEKEKEINALKTRFVSMVSHEYRTPLTSMQTATYLIEKFISLSDKDNASKFLDRIRESIGRMTAMLDEVLMISRVQSGKIDNKPRIFDVVNYARSIIDEITASDKSKHQIDFKTNAPKILIEIDERVLNHIFQNILSNAVKYSPASSLVMFEIVKCVDYIEFKIKDFGKGIPKSELQHLFEPFFRASNSGSIQGTGLGLSIVKQCVENLDGKIDVITEENKGSEFIIDLPILVEE